VWVLVHLGFLYLKKLKPFSTYPKPFSLRTMSQQNQIIDSIVTIFIALETRLNITQTSLPNQNLW
jgi:hypothetical protein